MQETELITIIETILSSKTETKNIEIKKASGGVPERLYDTFSSFSNTAGGVIIFGIDEKNNYEICGVQNVDLFQKKITEQALMMEPKIRPVISMCKYQGKIILSVEIPELDAYSKPCYYLGKGKIKGSYIRVGDTDLPMTDYEIYSLDAFKYKKEDELRNSERTTVDDLNQMAINGFLAKLSATKPNLTNLDKETILKANGIIDNKGNPTICGMMIFGKYPQMISPNLDIVAVKCIGNKYGIENTEGVRFMDSKRIDGTITEMLNLAMNFIINNTKIATKITPEGKRDDIEEYPLKAVREIILNSLLHRDYSIYTENEPIRIIIYDNRMEITNPGGLYGRLSLEKLGQERSDVRNPFMASILETLEIVENRYTGIPTIYVEMKKAGLPEPKFESERGTFKVTLYNKSIDQTKGDSFIDEITDFCLTPRSKEEIAKHFGYDESHPTYFIKTYIKPLIEKEILAYSLPIKTKSKKQKIYTIKKN